MFNYRHLLSLSLPFRTSLLVIGESSRTRMDVEASRRFYLYGGANHPRLRGVFASAKRSGAERSGQMARTKRVQRWEGGSVGQFVSHFISGLGHPSADSPPTPSPLHDIGERGFYFDPWRGLVNLRRRPSQFRGNNLGGCCSWKIGGWGKFVPIVSSVRKG